MTPKRAVRTPIRVMLVDDHPLWRTTLRRVLEHRRFAVVVGEADDGSKSLDVARESRPDIIVMDIDLPNVNGIEATRELVSEIPDVKILVLAASNERAQVLRAVEAGASGYLLKRAGADEVKDAVRRVHVGELAFPPALASVVLSELRRPSAAPRSSRGPAFHRQGDFWTVVYEGATFRLKDTRGARYLAQLLYEPGREFHALDLVAVDRGATRPIGGDAGAVLDRDAKVAYRRRIKDLQRELDEATEWGDRERESRARDEMDAITEQLAGAVGLGGRDRKAASHSERARVSVTLAIRSTLAKVAVHSSALAHHFSSTIRTGTYCSYSPDSRMPIAWQRGEDDPG